MVSSGGALTPIEATRGYYSTTPSPPLLFLRDKVKPQLPVIAIDLSEIPYREKLGLRILTSFLS